MAYTNAWDETQPPDSQLANQLGQDIRSLKTDIHERMFLVGTFAQRPTPEAAFAGMMYFATDTKLFYRWTGSQWFSLEVFPKFVDTNVHTITSNTTAVGSVCVIPANILRVGSLIKIAARGLIAGANGATFRTRAGAVIAGAWTIPTAAALSVFGEFHVGTSTLLESHGIIQVTGSTAQVWRNNLVVADVIANGIQIDVQGVCPSGSTLTSDYLSVMVF